MDMQLSGKTALVTGATAGIGRSAALALADEGVRLVLVARREEKLRQLADEIFVRTGVRPDIIASDLTDVDAPSRVASTALDKLGQVDILVNSAGGARPVTDVVSESNENAWQESFEINFTPRRRLTEALLPGMKANGFGRIINITGWGEMAGLDAAGPILNAVNVWSKALSRSIAKYGVTTNCVAPGICETEQIVGWIMPDEAAREQYVKDKVPVGRIGQPEDLAYAVTFLASPRANYITGIVLSVDGGRHMFPC